jgi:hypothetical protein
MGEPSGVTRADDDGPEADRLPVARPMPVHPAPRPTPHPPVEVADAAARDGEELAEALRAAADVAQVVAESAWKLAAFTTRAGVAGARYVVERATAGQNATEIMQDAARDLRAAAWRALVTPPEPRPVVQRLARGLTATELRRRGTELLRLSNDIHFSEKVHPAFARILGEITPDEARILRFLYVDGPQPGIDVRTNRPLSIGSHLVASGLNMIGEHAGCRNLHLVSQYLTNLQRLGLVDFSMEQVDNPQRYQVVEAQPKVADALRLAGRMPRIVHRSFALTEFGKAFCSVCLPVEDSWPPHDLFDRP